jgi:6-phosphogluconolactonase
VNPPSSPRLEVHDDASTLAAAVAGALVSRLAQAQLRGEQPHVALTGGTIADAVHHELARLAAGERGVDWSHVDFWWGDERFVAGGSSDRNAGTARAAFLDPVGADPTRVHEIGSTDDAATVAEAAESYGRELRTHGSGAFEVVMLGVGPDGHVASLFPGQPTLDIDDEIVAPVTNSPKPPPERVTLTLPTLNRTRATWLVVSGSEKAPAVARAVASDDLPAARVHGSEETVWFLDREAASEL